MAFDAATFLASLFRAGRQLCPADLPGDWHDIYEERAAIREYCGNIPRERADALALEETSRQMTKEK